MPIRVPIQHGIYHWLPDHLEWLDEEGIYRPCSRTPVMSDALGWVPQNAGWLVVNTALAVTAAIIPFRSFNPETTRRLAISLFAAAGALLLSALSLVGTGVSAGNMAYAAAVSGALWPLAMSACSGLLSLIFAEIAQHESTPEEGHPHSKRNYLESALVITGVLGLGQLIYGAFKLLIGAGVVSP